MKLMTWGFSYCW